MQLVDGSDPIDLTWVGGFFKDEKAIPLAKLAIKDFGFCLPFFVQLSFQDSKQNQFWKTYLTSQGFRRPIFCWFLYQELLENEELKVKVVAQKHFVMWPKVELDQTKKGKRTVTAADLKMNKIVIAPFIGRSFFFKTLGHKDFLYNVMTQLNGHWGVSWSDSCIFSGKTWTSVQRVYYVILYFNGFIFYFWEFSFSQK